MNEKYSDYVNRHVNAVNKCYRLLTGRELKDCNGNIAHDKSKWNNEEYDAYAEYFFPSDGSEPKKDPARKADFQRAWLHHQNTNPHHWQYWCLIDGDGQIKPLVMPLGDIYEMVSDWGAFAYLSGKADDLAAWYEANKDKMILHDDTRKIVESLVVVLWAKLDEYFKNQELEDK